MKTKIINFILLFVFLIAMLPLVNARISTSYRHLSDDYAVTFFEREGDALVSARLQIKNVQSNESITYLTLEIPGEVIVYDIGELVYEEDYRRISEDAYSRGFAETIYRQTYKKIREKDIIEQELKNLTVLTIILPKEIKAGEDATILLTYKLKKYAKKGLFGAYEFDFETINDINSDLAISTRVAIDVVPGLYWHGKGTEVKYSLPPNIKYIIPEIKRLNETNQSNKSVEEKIKPYNSYEYESIGGAPLSSISYRSDEMPTMQKLQMEVVYNKDEEFPISSHLGGMGSYSNAISNAGGYVKTASYLDNREVFHVKGIYSSSKYRLYLGKIILGSLISLIFILILIKVLPEAIYAVRTKIKGLRLEKKAKEKAIKIKKELGFRKITLISLLSAISMAILFFIVVGIFNWATKSGLSSSSNPISILFFVIIIMIIVLKAAIFIGIPVYFGINYGIRKGILIIFNTILWILVLMLIIVPFIQWLKW